MSLGEPESLLKVEQSELFCCRDGQVECVAQPRDTSPVSGRSAHNYRCALQQQHAGGQTGVRRERQHRQAFQWDSWTVEEWGCQLVQFLETGRLQEPSPHHGAEFQHVWTNLQVQTRLHISWNNCCSYVDWITKVDKTDHLNYLTGLKLVNPSMNSFVD